MQKGQKNQVNLHNPQVNHFTANQFQLCLLSSFNYSVIKTQTNHISAIEAIMLRTFISRDNVCWWHLILDLILGLQKLVCSLYGSLRERLSFIDTLFIFWPLHLLHLPVLWLALQMEPCPQRRGKEDEMKDSYGCARHGGGCRRSPPERVN